MKKYILAVVVMLVAIFTVFGCVKTLKVDEQNEVASSEDVKIEEVSVESEYKSDSVEETDTTEEKQEEIQEEVQEVQEGVQQEQAKEDNKTSKPKSDKNTVTAKPSNNTTAKPNNSNTTNKTPQSKNPYYIKVNRQANCVTIYTKNENGEYTVPVKAMVCSVGKTAGSTPAGVFKISARYTWRALYGNQYGQYSVRFNGSILFHSVPYAKQSKDSLKTDYYNRLGVADSMGCVRLTCADAKWIYDNCANGTVVEVYDSPDPGPLGKPSAPKIDVNSPYKGWDPTDPDPKNPWKNQKPILSGVKNITTDCGVAVDLLSGVSAKDANGNVLQVNVAGEVDFNVPGTYNIIYTAKSASGSSISAIAVVTVLEVEIDMGENQNPEENPEENPEITPDDNSGEAEEIPEVPEGKTEEEQE